MSHIINAETAKNLLETKGYTVERLPDGFTVFDEHGHVVAKTAVDVNGYVSRHALKHLGF